MKMDQRLNCEALAISELVEGHVGQSTNGFNAQQNGIKNYWHRPRDAN